MTDETDETLRVIVVRIDPSDQDPKIPEDHPDACPDCKVPTEMGYGMAGGGIGVYSYCPQCYKILAKTQDHG